MLVFFCTTPHSPKSGINIVLDARLDARLNVRLDFRLDVRLNERLGSMFGSMCGSMRGSMRGSSHGSSHGSMHGSDSRARLNVPLDAEKWDNKLQLEVWLGCSDFWLVSLLSERSWLNEIFGFVLTFVRKDYLYRG